MSSRCYHAQSGEAPVDPPPPGSINGNVSFDAMTNPVIAFFEVCSGCPLGTAELQGTG